MASLVTFAKKLWKDATSGGTPITAAELNRMEGGINDCATQINRLGDSVCQKNMVWYSNKASVDMTGKQIVIVLCSVGSSTETYAFFIWYSSAKIISTSKLPDGMALDVSGPVASFTYTCDQSWVFLTV